MADVNDVAAAILELHGPMSTMKLQKLAYYSQAWHLVWDEEPLFDAEIQAWAAGPVVRELYNHHRGFYSVAEWPWGSPMALTPSETGTVAAIVKSYGKLSGRQLSHLTHNERPWQEARTGLSAGARSNARIDVEVMAEYYSGIAEDTSAEAIEDLADTLPGGSGEPS